MFRREFTKTYEIVSRLANNANDTIECLELLATAAHRCSPPRVDESLKAWMTIIQISPTHIKALYHSGLIYYREKQEYRNAKALMKRAIKAIDTHEQQDSSMNAVTHPIAKPYSFYCSSIPYDVESDGFAREEQQFSCLVAATHPHGYKDWAIIILAELYLIEGKMKKAEEALNSVSMVFLFAACTSVLLARLDQTTT